MIAAETGKLEGSVQAFFGDNTMQEMGHFALSTSTLSSPALSAASFGPVNADCYGLAYVVAKDSFSASVTSYQRESKRFAECVTEAAKQIREVIQYTD